MGNLARLVHVGADGIRPTIATEAAIAESRAGLSDCRSINVKVSVVKVGQEFGGVI